MIAIALSAAVLAFSPAASNPQAPVRIAAKKFTESVLLCGSLEILLEDAGLTVSNSGELGGTRILWNALLEGEIDVYPEYTGTILKEILEAESFTTWGEAEAHLESLGLRATASLGFDNNYALGVTRARHLELALVKISDLAKHPDLALGFGGEFLDREDGWKGLRVHYALPHEDVRGLDHDLAYRALSSGAIAVTDLYRTDAEIAGYDLIALEDDREYFSSYAALFLYRSDLETRVPGAIEKIRLLEGRITSSAMIDANAQAKLDGHPERSVSGALLAASLEAPRFANDLHSHPTRLDRILTRTGEQLFLVLISLIAAILAGIPLGVVAAHSRRAAPWILGLCGLFWTVPSLALFVFLIPVLGIGAPPATLALFLYSLLPIVRNTSQGISSIDPELLESADALGLSSHFRLKQIELPLASPAILAGIKIAAVICVGTATLGALIGAGGYGQPILTGIRLADTGLMLEGALPSAAMALACLGLFAWAEKRLIPRGLR